MKFAPGLKVLMYYNLTQQKKKNVVTNLRDYDVIVTTPHLKLPEPIVQNVKFHRLVIDESHLLEQGGAGTMSGKSDALIKYQVRPLKGRSHRPPRPARAAVGGRSAGRRAARSHARRSRAAPVVGRRQPEVRIHRAAWRATLPRLLVWRARVPRL